MEITRISIHNYRSIKDLEMTCGSNVILLGENNSGKSNILAAIEFALSSSAKPEPEDLFAFRDDGNDSLWVELTFAKLTEQEKRTFSKYIRHDATMCFRKTAQWDQSGKVGVQYNGFVEEPAEAWLQSDNAANYARRDEAEKTPLAQYLPAGRLSKAHVEDAQRKYIEAHADETQFEERLETGPLFGQKTIAAGLLPDYYHVPAIRDLDDEAKFKSTTMFGKLMSRTLEEMAAKDQRFIQVRSDLDTLVKSFNRSNANSDRPRQLTVLEDSLKGELSDWGVDVEIRIDTLDIGKIFELGTSLWLDDGLSTLAQRKGHGLQRAVVFGLIKAWATVSQQHINQEDLSPRRASETMIFGIEEPELFLHPQAQRALTVALRRLGNADNYQVFLCSHSAHFVDLDHYQDIVIASKSSARLGTSIRQCKQDLFEGPDVNDRKKRFHMAYWINPDRGEMFFAKKVVLVEGETEKTLLPYLAQRLGCHDTSVSIVDCGSKHNLPLYITIANAFKLNYHVVHDEDPLPDPIPEDWDDDKRREKRRTYDLNSEIANLIKIRGKVSICSGDLETLSGVSKAQGKNKGKALAAIEHFQGLDDFEIPADLVKLVMAVYASDNASDIPKPG